MNLKILNKRIKQFDALPIKEFFYTDSWPFFHQQTRGLLALYPTRRTLPGDVLRVETEPLNLGFVHFLYSSTLHVGYAFEFMRRTNLLRHRYFFVAQPVVPVDWVHLKKNGQVDTFLSNEYICIATYGEDVLTANRKELLHPMLMP